MFDTTDQTGAHAQGWRLVTTVEHGTRRAVWDVARHGERFKTDREAMAAVVDAAKRGSAYHQQALQLVVSSRGAKRKK